MDRWSSALRHGSVAPVAVIDLPGGIVARAACRCRRLEYCLILPGWPVVGRVEGQRVLRLAGWPGRFLLPLAGILRVPGRHRPGPRSRARAPLPAGLLCPQRRQLCCQRRPQRRDLLGRRARRRRRRRLRHRGRRGERLSLPIRQPARRLAAGRGRLALRPPPPVPVGLLPRRSAARGPPPPQPVDPQPQRRLPRAPRLFAPRELGRDGPRVGPVPSPAASALAARPRRRRLRAVAARRRAARLLRLLPRLLLLRPRPRPPPPAAPVASAAIQRGHGRGAVGA